MTLSNTSKLAIVSIIVLVMLIPSVPEVHATPIIVPDIPRTANANETVWVFVNITSSTEDIYEVLLSYTNPANSNQMDERSYEPEAGNKTNGTWSFSIPAQTYKGTLEVSILATDNSGVSTRYPANGYYTITLDGPEKSKPFPWNLVLIVAFLAVTLVVTELIFKPGVYRPTGRQRAAALEEEDRIRELEDQKNREK